MRHGIGRENAESPKDKRTTADLVWQITKHLKECDVTTLHEIKAKFKPSPTRLHMAIKWLQKPGFIVMNGNHIALTQAGISFHDKRKEMSDAV